MTQTHFEIIQRLIFALEITVLAGSLNVTQSKLLWSHSHMTDINALHVFLSLFSEIIHQKHLA